MSRKIVKSSDEIFIWIIVVVVVNLFTSHGEITWAKWPVLGLLIVYLMNFLSDDERDSRELVLLKERYAKGELTEEEFLQRKKAIETDFSRSRGSGHRYFIGIALIVFGVVSIFRGYLPVSIPWLELILIGAGLFAISRHFK
jgi:hypothetical protein